MVGLISGLVGVIVGAMSGYFRGWTESVLMRFTDIVIIIPILLGASFALVTTLHLAAAWRERDTQPASPGWIVVGPPESIPDKCAHIVVAPDGERIAVFRDGS